jgi:hypothetical protein
MALTIALDGIGIIANASSTTESLGTGTNQWNEDGFGTDSFTTDTFLQGGESFAGAYSNRAGFQYYRTAVSYDFSEGTGDFGQFIWIWVNCPTLGLLETRDNKGLAIRIGSTLTAYTDYYIGGRDDSNGWLGDWKCFVIDPNIAGTLDTGGGLDITNVNYIGVWIETIANAKGDNIFIDQIAIARGLEITGTWDNVTYSGAWEEVEAYCSNYSVRALGNFQSKSGIYYMQGSINIGDSTQTQATVFEDSNKVIKFDTSEFWNGSAWVSTYTSTSSIGIRILDSTGFSTEFTDGVPVGTDNGRNGCTYIGGAESVNQRMSFQASTTQNASSFVRLYGTTIRNARGTVSFGSSSNDKILGATIASSSQLVTGGPALIRNSIISGFTTALTTEAALLYSSGTDIQDCSFISNDYAIEIGTGTSTDFTNLIFSSNTVDVNNQTGATHTINKLGTTNASTSSGSTVVFVGLKTLTVNNIQVDTELRIYSYTDINDPNTYTELAGIESIGTVTAGDNGFTTPVLANGVYSTTLSYNTGAGDIPVILVAHALTSEFFRESLTLSSTENTSFTVFQIDDRQYNPGSA